MDILQEHVDISHLSGMKTRAYARYFFELSTSDDIHILADIYAFAQENNLPVLCIGGGTNMLFAFDEFQGIVLKNSISGYTYDSSTRRLTAGSAMNVTQMATELKDNGETRWARFVGLPGSVGWATYGNAGCFGLEMQHHFQSAKVWNIAKRKIEFLSREDMQFEYRTSLLKKTKNFLVLEVTFDLSRDEEKYSSDVDVYDFRTNKQPSGNSCGSFFQNPSREMSAGLLIELIGAKGYSYNNAYFSEKHANFLMTREDFWDYKDLLYLIDYVQKTVWKQHQIRLVPEVQIITNPS